MKAETIIYKLEADAAVIDNAIEATENHRTEKHSHCGCGSGCGNTQESGRREIIQLIIGTGIFAAGIITEHSF